MNEWRTRSLVRWIKIQDYEYILYYDTIQPNSVFFLLLHSVLFWCCADADERESKKMLLIEGRKNEENPKCPDGTNTAAEGEKNESEIRKSEEKFCVGATTSTMNPNPEEEKSINVECSADSGVTVCSAALLDDSSRGFFPFIHSLSSASGAFFALDGK